MTAAVEPLPDPVGYRDDNIWPPERRMAHLLDWLHAHPDKHEQEIWIASRAPGKAWRAPTPDLSCGTTACGAGWVSLFAGATPYDWHRAAPSAGWSTAYVRLPDDVPVLDYEPSIMQVADEVDIPWYAGRLLGFSSDEAFDVFRARDLDELTRLCEGTATGQRMLAQGLREPTT